MTETSLIDTGQEWGSQIFAKQSLATKEEIRAASGRNRYIEIDPFPTVFDTITDKETRVLPPLWEINVWGFDRDEVGARAAKVLAFLESRKTE